MTDRELIKEARDLIVMCSLLDKSRECYKMADKMDKQLTMPVVSDSFICVKDQEPPKNTEIIALEAIEEAKREWYGEMYDLAHDTNESEVLLFLERNEDTFNAL